MSRPTRGEPSRKNYFVDEAGDGNLFTSGGGVLLGTEGSSRYFILGMIDIPEPQVISHDLEELRKNLLADPYFKNTPSMKPEQGKTALAFHAKDDLPEVRREVLSLLRKYKFRFFAVVRNKRALLDYVRQRNRQDPEYRYNPNELYEFMVRRLFTEKLHRDDAYEICFARRGKSDRTEALNHALQMARLNFFRKRRIMGTAAITIRAAYPYQAGGLQVADYFLWSLQRFFERREDQYVELLWDSFRLVRDLDDTRQAKYGVYYTQEKPLKVAALPDLPEI